MTIGTTQICFVNIDIAKHPVVSEDSPMTYSPPYMLTHDVDITILVTIGLTQSQQFMKYLSCLIA